ncbi:MAG: carboxypeptidase regulatory-like domain-containing protein [Saprospiraceae bacterium]|nr:carboxypeptidase regulatory-like domain-containing protein [Saprospiraceae bacterium]MBL0113604.1 carboxypeptidase regulatory-like domain-containing protein [Saprospiraceae bacterium]MBP7801773.1 carboxypeptidase regulatory-like domain-containing protein [Saprospiraceae bacterium]MBP8097170.1 carboxypeptidase regulatory-like domain-containing protein [Saprospiraceae bacterium]
MKEFYTLSTSVTKIILMILFAGISTLSFGQGVTSANIAGLITDKSGEPLIGATVIAIHEPSGSQYGTATREDGRFNIPNVRIGGPYSITVSYVGYNTYQEKNIELSLGQTLQFRAKLGEESSLIEEVTVVSDKGSILSSERTGAGATIKKEMLEAMPTISRGLNDFLRFVPQSRSSSVASTAGSGVSFAGQDSRFNNLTIDGTIFNNSFGLASAPGGQTNSTPISLDAIEEIQVSLAPYDVRQGGFTGAGINAVTRSGTNKTQGSVFFSGRNQDYVGSNAAGTDVVTANFNVKQAGGRLGGAIIKNKLFYFVNYEQELRSDPSSSYLANRGTSGNNVTRVLASDLDALSAFLKTKFNYNTGAYEGFPLATESRKGLAKIDYNINQKNRLSVRFNYLKSFRDVTMSNSGVVSGNRSNNLFAMNFQNANYIINNDLYSGIVELNTILGSKMSNNLQFGYTANRDYRSSGGGVFPLVDILKDGTTYTSFGYEPFTANNILNTDTWQFKDDVTFYAGRHTITAGVNVETFKFDNTFTPTYYGQYVYNSLEDFYAAANGDASITTRRYALTYSALPGHALPTATTRASQPGIYIQDELNMMQDKFKLTYGLRLDMPIFGKTARNNPEVEGFTFQDAENKPLKLSTSKLPGAKILFSPRVGFNWDVKGDRSLQIRGGTGIFSGRPAFVWISNQVGNNGILTGSFTFNDTKNYPFSDNVEKYIPENATTPASYNIAVTDPNFKFPQLLRTNIGVDFKMPFGMVGTLEGIFSKNLNQIYYINANQEKATGSYSGADNRPTFPGLGLTSTAQNNALRIVDKITDAILLTNTNKGYTYSLTAQVQKQFAKNFFLNAAYNFGEAKDLMTAGSIAFSSWRDNPSLLGNNLQQLAFSDNDQRHRIIAGMYYKIPWSKFASTAFNLGLQSGNIGRATYVVNGDLNGDAQTSNDLMYIPTSSSEIQFEQYTVGSGASARTVTVDAQKAAFDKFIASSPYLSDNKGSYATRNGYLLPWLTTVDASITQDISVKVAGQRNTLQFRLDMVNLTNFINSDWGVATVTTTRNPLQFRSRNATTNQPVYRFTELSGALPTDALRTSSSLSDVWQIQLGVRYIFN